MFWIEAAQIVQIGIGCSKQFIVMNSNANSFELIETFDISSSSEKPIVEYIQDDCSGFKNYEGSAILKYKYFCKENGISFPEIGRMEGYPDVCENYAFLSDIIERKSVPVKAYNISLRNLNDEKKWNYIFTQADADNFMKMFAGFHDSTLEKILYWECDRSASAIATFDNSGWFGIVELYFEGIQVMKILPPKPNCTREIFDASLIVEDDSIFWVDRYMTNVDMAYDGSIMKALSLKWRKI